MAEMESEKPRADINSKRVISVVIATLLTSRQRKETAGGQRNEASRRTVHCKKCPHVRAYFVASFPHLNGTGSVYVCIRKSTEY